MKTKEAIVQQALPIFLNYGYDGVSMNQLLEQLGMSKGGYYHHFSNKEELAIMVAESMYVNQFDQIIDICKNTDTLREKISQIGDIVQAYLHAYDVAQFLHSYRFMFQMKLKSEAINDRIKDSYSGLYEAVEAMLCQAVESKEIGATVEVKSQALILIALIEGILMLSSSMTEAINEHVTNMFESYYMRLRGDK